MTRSESQVNLIKAKIAFKLSVGPIHPNKKGNFGKYADIKQVWDAITEPLAKCGLDIEQWVTYIQKEDGTFQDCIITRLSHISGEFSESKILVRQEKAGNQEWGKAITYAKRYALVACLGLPNYEDDDGQSDQNATEKSKVPDMPSSSENKEAAPVAKEAAPAASLEFLTSEQKAYLRQYVAKFPQEAAEMLAKFGYSADDKDPKAYWKMKKGQFEQFKGMVKNG
jgi:hypothetical protein